MERESAIGISECAAGAIAAQRALHELRASPEASGLLVAAVLASSPDGRTSADWLRGFLREVEKSVR
jgi:hypothetical protein